MEASREIQLSAGTIRYADTGGDGPGIVFVHGLLATGALWSAVVPLLAGDARCIVPELPLGAHKQPMKPDADLSPRSVARLIAELMEKLDLSDVTLVGNDTGGAICQLLVTEHPERVGRLVLTPCEAIEDAFATYFGNPAVRRDTEKFVRAVSKKDTLAAAERLRDFDRPVLLAWARGDKFFKVRLAERLLERLPNGRLELIDDSYTFVSIDQPERLAQLVREFVFDGVREGVTT